MRVSFGLSAAGGLTPLLLGKEESVWRMSVEAPEELLDKLGQDSSSYELADLRSLMPELSTEELAVAGHAVALSNWHRVVYLTNSAPIPNSASAAARLAIAGCPEYSHHDHFLSACEGAVHVRLSLGLLDSKTLT